MSRTYVVGLPVAITIEDDGSVSIDVDLSEAGEGIVEDDAEYDPPNDPLTQESDAAHVEDLYTQHPQGMDTFKLSWSYSTWSV